MLRGERVPPQRPIKMPYLPFHRFGGMGRLLFPGKGVMVIGPSGTGKTSLFERMIDNQNKDGQSVFLWGPEWRPEEYAMRRVARYGGPTIEAQWDHVAWLSEEKNGTPRADNDFSALTAAQLAQAQRILADVGKWEGQTHFIETARISVSEVMREVRQRVPDLRARGQRVTAFYGDYLQKMLSGEDVSWYDMEAIVQEVWATCVDLGLVWFVTSQVNKGVLDQLQNGNIDGVGETQAQMISIQKFNLVVSISPVFDGQGLRMERARVRPVKMSYGRGVRELVVKTALHRHDWTDEIVPDAAEPSPAFSSGRSTRWTSED